MTISRRDFLAGMTGATAQMALLGGSAFGAKGGKGGGKGQNPLNDPLFTQVKVGGHQSVAVIEIDYVSAEIERVHKRHDSSRRRYDGRSDPPTEIRAHVTTLNLVVEHPTMPETARDAGLPGRDEGSAPHSRCVV